MAVAGSGSGMFTHHSGATPSTPEKKGVFYRKDTHGNFIEVTRPETKEEALELLQLITTTLPVWKEGRTEAGFQDMDDEYDDAIKESKLFMEELKNLGFTDEMIKKSKVIELSKPAYIAGMVLEIHLSRAFGIPEPSPFPLHRIGIGGIIIGEDIKDL
jgi:hypothetical protein